MTDDQADVWFKDHANYSMTQEPGVTHYRLSEAGSDDHVEITIPEMVIHPDPVLVQRFLVRWFLSAYEPASAPASTA